MVLISKSETFFPTSYNLVINFVASRNYAFSNLLTFSFEGVGGGGRYSVHFE